MVLYPQDIEKVEAEINDVASNITKNEKIIDKARLKGEDISCLERRVNHLYDEKLQLRKEKERLQVKEIVLLKIKIILVRMIVIMIYFVYI